MLSDRVLPYVWYPLLAAAAITAFASMLAAGTGPALAAYVPVVAVAIAIVALEWRFPEHLAWQPRWSDVRSDAAFMTLVQVALPRAFAALFAIGLATWTHEHAPSSLWPHGWPLAAQGVLMVLSVDFMRYWLHRACHRFPLLWRLHEVHHSPDILYVLNVGRFHPFEKALHFCFDSAPFLALGVAPELIASYFLLYSVNGLFQHSNVRLRYGWLNYVVGSAETHRWHHARDPRTAACNFGNTTIVWDLVFGTWHLPRHSRIEDIGIPDRKYPKDFRSQMLAPFRGVRQSAGSLVANALVKFRLRIGLVMAAREVAITSRDPMNVQRRLLARILSDNGRTAFGREHGFEGISSIREYQERVPVNDYEALRPHVDAEIERGDCALTSEAPAAYARTSGTTGKPKDVPLTASYLRALRKIQSMSVAFQYRTCPEAFEGAILVIVSPKHEGSLPNGKMYGAASGVVAGDTPRLVQQKFVVPASVLTIADSRLKYLTILRLGLARPDVTYLGSANPTTLLTLIRIYREHETQLIEDLRKGSFFWEREIPSNVLRDVRPLLKAQPVRAASLDRARQAGGHVCLRDLWPNLQLVVTWTCASAGIAADALRSELAPRTRVLELGYVSSEFRGTFTLGKRADSGWPTLDTHFFEFAESERWDRGERELVTLDGLRKGIDYYVVVTTPSGLYRYFINDIVTVTGYFNRTPLLRFRQKGKGVTNITGEKLYEAQVLTAVRASVDEAGCAARFVMMLADEQACAYRLYVEADGIVKPAKWLATSVERKLCELNVEYAAKLESGRLRALEAVWLAAGAGDEYKRSCIQQGQREGQFKTVAIAYRRDFRFDLDAFVEERSA